MRVLAPERRSGGVGSEAEPTRWRVDQSGCKDSVLEHMMEWPGQREKWRVDSADIDDSMKAEDNMSDT